MIQSSIELSKPLGDKIANLDRVFCLSGETKDSVKVLVDYETIFNYFEKEGDLVLNMSIPQLGIATWCRITLTPHDKIDILNYINKDNNRIKSQIEEMQHIVKTYEKTAEKEYATDTLQPYYDSVSSKDIKDGILWFYKKDGKVVDTAFMSYKQLYEIQIAPKPKICQFCDENHELEFIRPREDESGIYLCKQHMKYIQRISEKANGNRYYFIRKSDYAKIDIAEAYKMSPEILANEYTLYDSWV